MTLLCKQPALASLVAIVMRLYGWMNHLSTQLAKGSASPAYCLHIHQVWCCYGNLHIHLCVIVSLPLQHPPLTPVQKEHFVAVLRRKEDLLLSRKTEFEV